MDKRLKERLTGAAVLIMFAVIFIPMILDNSLQQEVDITETNIPPKADMTYKSPLVPINEPEPSSTTRPAGTSINTETQADPDPAQPEVATEPVVTVPATETETVVTAENEAQIRQPEPRGMSAWVIQLGSFTSRSNATSLVQQLQGDGYPAYVEEVGTGPALVYRVRVGPELLKSDAEKIRESLNEKLKLDGILLRYP